MRTLGSSCRFLLLACGLSVVPNGPTAQGQCPPQQSAKLTASDAAGFDQFGYAVALSGDTAVVGAWLDDHAAGADAGSAYVFVRSGGVWTQQAKLTASDAAIQDRFGTSVAISGDSVVVGAYTDDTTAGSDAGSAYVFVRLGTVWTQQAKLIASDAAPSDQFGISVAIAGDTVIVGADRDDDAGESSGSAYVFVRSGTVWAQQSKLTASDAMVTDFFGGSVALSGDTAVVGAGLDNNTAGEDAGSAYVFVRLGTVWTQQAKLIGTDTAAFDELGWAVAISGDTALIGALNDEFGVGSAYVFVRSGTVWTQQAKLTASDAGPNDFDYFGASVGLSGNTAIVGSPYDIHAGGSSAGSAYIYSRSGTVWTQRPKVTASDAAADDHFGYAVAVSGDAALVGSYGDNNAGGTDAGSAYVFGLACCPGDVNGDRAVDLSDLAILLAHFGTASGATLADGDLDGNGSVDLSDLSILLSRFGTTCP